MSLRHLLFLLSLCIGNCLGYDVLLVIGGMYIESRIGYTVNAVEAVGPHHVCRLYNLPFQRHSLFGGRLKDRAIVCGGHDGTYERSECYVMYSHAQGRWVPMTPDLGQPLIFAAAAGDGQDNFYVVGGRRYNHENRIWDYQSEARVFNINDNQWRNLPALPKPMANACLLTLGSTLIFSGGAKMRY